jgi:thioredoxin reductase (NADPH)
MTASDDQVEFEVAVVGGGPAGLTAALYTTRLGHETVLVDRGGGRAAMMLDTHNVIGVTEETSGNEFLATAREQVGAYGATLRRGLVTDVSERADGRFDVTTDAETLVADRVVLAVGFSDERPDPPLPRTGRGLHYCLHCDAYMFVDEPVYVMGHGDSAAYVAMIMLNFTPEVDLLLRGAEPTWSDETDRLIRNHPVEVVEAEVVGMRKREDGWLEGFEFADGRFREYRGGFAMYGSDYHDDLAAGLGVDLNEDGTVAVDDHGRTSVDGVYAVGDLVPGHNQIPVAMGQGAKAGIAIHMDLREFPRSIEAIEREGPVTEADVPGIASGVREAARAFNGAGEAVDAPGDD